VRRANAGPRRPAGPLLDATFYATLACLAYGLASGALDLAPPVESLAWLAVLALTSQVLGWLLISISLPALPAALASVLLLVQPVGAVLLGMVILDEVPTALQFAGVAVVLAGVLVATGVVSRPRGRLRRPAVW
jgi:drug/metabolite transporter (DMT)-like permease